jgi:hypothetical protein
MTPPWLARVLEQSESLALDCAADRVRLAEILMAEMPRVQMLTAARDGIRMRLQKRAIAVDESLASDLANDALTAAMMVLVGE